MSRLWYDQQGQLWNWRGASMFSLPMRARAGEDWTPQTTWMKKTGVGVARIFADYGGPGQFPFNDPTYPYFLNDFLEAMRLEHQIRCEVTVVSQYDSNMEYRRRSLGLVYEMLAAERFHFVNVENEPWNRGDDVVELMQGINRHQVVSDYGICPVHGPGPVSYQNCPHLDYIGPHLPRDLSHYYRNSKDMQEMWPLDVPLVSREPLGVADYDKQGSGARSTDLKAHVWHHAIARLYGGSTIHSQFGLEGRAPSDDEPISQKICSAISAVWRDIPEWAYSGQYARAGLGDFPFTITTDDAIDGRGYAAVHPNVAYVVVPGAVPGYEPKLQGTWTAYRAIGPMDCAIFEATR